MSESIRTAFAFNWNMINDWTPISARTNNLRPRAVYRAGAGSGLFCSGFFPMAVLWCKRAAGDPEIVNGCFLIGGLFCLGIWCFISKFELWSMRILLCGCPVIKRGEFESLEIAGFVSRILMGNFCFVSRLSYDCRAIVWDVFFLCVDTRELKSSYVSFLCETSVEDVK